MDVCMHACMSLCVRTNRCIEGWIGGCADASVRHVHRTLASLGSTWTRKRAHGASEQSQVDKGLQQRLTSILFRM